MSLLIRISGCFIFAGVLLVPLNARQWSDASGNYTWEAELIGFDDEHVIFQRENKELGTCPVDQLSAADQEFLKSQEAQQIHDDNLAKAQVWTTRNGLQVVGRVVDYTRREVTVQRRRGRIYVNSTVFQNLPEIYQRIVLQTISHLESEEVTDLPSLQRWVRTLRGQPRTYTLDGVVFEFENGDEYEVPFFLFAPEDEQLLKAGWEDWVQHIEDYEKRDDHALWLQAQAAAFQQDREVKQRIAMMNLNLQAVRAGLTSLWEVTLYPVAGNPQPPRWVISQGRDSETATQAALQQNPGFMRGPVRRVSR